MINYIYAILIGILCGVCGFICFLRATKDDDVVDACVGDIVCTRNCLDIGFVAEVQCGEPKKIYSRYRNNDGFSTFGGINTVTWYNTGINMSLEEWEKILDNTKDAEGFYIYWRNRLSGIDWSYTT